MSNYSEGLPLGSKVVLEFLSHVSNPTDYAVFFDKYFTSYDLLVKLKNKGFKATGTLRENHAGKPPLPSSKEQKKMQSSYDYRLESINSILVTISG